MNIQGVFVGLFMLIIGLVWILRPSWVLKLVISSTASELKVKILTKVVQALGVVTALFALYAAINTLFFVK